MSKSKLLAKLKKTVIGSAGKYWHEYASLEDQLDVCLLKVYEDLRKKGVSREYISEKGFSRFIRPATKNILRSLSYRSVNDICTIMVGLDPYPSKSNAMGLAFSAPKTVETPVSLRNIYKCLLYHNLVNEIPDNGCLENWSKQGVLLLNTFLTRTAEIVNGDINGEGAKNTKNQHPFWKDFTISIIQHVIVNSKYKPVIMLWGKEAQSLEILIKKNLDPEYRDKMTILKWGHPSGANPNNGPNSPVRFEICDHFIKANKLLKSNNKIINWDPSVKPEKKSKKATKIPEVSETSKEQEDFSQDTKDPKDVKYLLAFTDGGCTGNGSNKAKASFCVYYPESFCGHMNLENFQNKKVYGLVPTYTMKLKKSKTSIKILTDTNSKIKPSNNRGELLALIYAFLSIYETLSNDSDPKAYCIVIITDSELGLKTVKEWMWNWYKVDPSFEHRKNPDLVRILYECVTGIQNLMGIKNRLNLFTNKIGTPGVVMLHQNSHLDKKGLIPKKIKDVVGGGIDYEKYMGNKTADEIASNALKLKDYEIKRD